jgi:Tol biopolymer transport system component
LGIATALASSLACLALATAPAAFQGYRLNDPLARSPLGGVGSFQVDPTGTRVAFLADMDPVQSHMQVFVAPADGSSPPIQLTNVPSQFSLSAVGTIADGSQVLFLGQVAATRRLYIVPADGSLGPRQLSAMPQDRQVWDYLSSPVGNRVVYLADQDVDGVFELYSRPADFSALPVKLSGTMVNGGDVTDYRISPDGSRVVYRADQDADGVIDLYSAPVDGSAPPVRLNLSRPNADVEYDFVIAFDSLGVIFRADQDADGVVELYAVRIDGSAAPMKRNGPLVTGGDVFQFALSSSDDRLIYRADQTTDEVFELWSTRAIAGGTPVKLSATLPAGGRVWDLALSPDGTHVVYRANDVELAYRELFGVPADGSAPAVQLSHPIANQLTNFVGLAFAFTIPGIDDRALFVKSTGISSSLYSVPLDGSQPATVLGEGLSDVEAVLPDGTVLALGTSPLGVKELFAVPLDGSAAPERLNGPMVSGGQVLEALPSSSTSHAVYRAHQNHYAAPELFSVAVSGGAVRRLSPPMPLGAPSGISELFPFIHSFEVSPDGTRAVYDAREGSSAIYDLHGVATDGGGGSTRMHGPLGADRGIREYRVSPDGTRVVYELERDYPFPYPFTVELYSARIDEHGTSVRLDDGPLAGNVPSDDFFYLVDSATFTPDSTHVVYVGTNGASGDVELFLVPSDGSAQPVALHPGAAPGDDVDFTLSSDGDWVVYSRLESTHEELFRVPLDGHLPPARLHAPYAGGQNLGGDATSSTPYLWTISPDSTRVVYISDQDTEAVTELYSAPIDASQAPVKLNGTFTAQSDIAVLDSSNDPPFLVSPDSARVVYRADQEVDGRFELYSVALAGGPALKLNGTLVAGGDVGHFAIDPSSTRAIYVANEELSYRKALWSVPLDGSAPRVKLSSGTTGNVSALALGHRPFVISSAGRVVYRADNLVPGQAELWSAPIDGSSAPLRLNAPLPALSDVYDDFQLSSDGTRVVYAADQLVQDTIELFVVPIDGSAAPRRVSGPLVEGGDVDLDPSLFTWSAVRGFRVTANDLVLYLADQDVDGVIELYASALDWQRGPRRR